MMHNENTGTGFNLLGKYIMEGQSMKVPNRNPVIKQEQVNLEEPQSIQVKHEVNAADHDIQPLIENDEIVGVVHTCSCGRSVEIHFNFTEQ